MQAVSTRMECDEWELEEARKGAAEWQLSSLALSKIICRNRANGSTLLKFSTPRIGLFVDEKQDSSLSSSDVRDMTRSNLKDDISLCWIQSTSLAWKMRSLKNIFFQTCHQVSINRLAQICELVAGSDNEDTLSCALFIRATCTSESNIVLHSEVPCFTKWKIIDQPRTSWRILDQLFGETSGTDHNNSNWTVIYSLLVEETDICNDIEASDILTLLKSLMGLVAVPMSSWQQSNKENFPSDLAHVTDLLHITDIESLRKLIASKSLRIKRETEDILIPLKDEQIMSRIDSIVCDVYHLIFRYLISKINLMELERQEILADARDSCLPLPCNGVLLTNGLSFSDCIGSFDSLMSNYLDERLYRHHVTNNFTGDMISILLHPCPQDDFPVIDGKDGVFEVLEEVSLGPQSMELGNDTIAKRISSKSQNSFASSLSIGKYSSTLESSPKHLQQQHRLSSLFGVSHFHQTTIYCAEDMLQKNRGSSDFHLTSKLLQLSCLPLSTSLLELLSPFGRKEFAGKGEEGTVVSISHASQVNLEMQPSRIGGRLAHQSFLSEVDGLLNVVEQSFSSYYTIVDLHSLPSSCNEFNSFFVEHSHLFNMLLSNHRVMQQRIVIEEYAGVFRSAVDVLDITSDKKVDLLQPRVLSLPAILEISYPNSLLRSNYVRSSCSAVMISANTLFTDKSSWESLLVYFESTKEQAANCIVKFFRSYCRKHEENKVADCNSCGATSISSNVTTSPLKVLKGTIEHKLQRTKGIIAVNRRFQRLCLQTFFQRWHRYTLQVRELNRVKQQESDYRIIFDSLNKINFPENFSVLLFKVLKETEESLAVMSKEEKIDIFLYLFVVVILSQM